MILRKEMELLEKGIHTTQFEGEIPIKEMSDKHLMNSIKFARRHKGHTYWDKALGKFVCERLRRNSIN